MNISTSITLDLQTGQNAVTKIQAKQYDTGRSVAITIQNAGTNWSIPAGAKGILAVRTAAGRQVFYDKTLTASSSNAGVYIAIDGDAWAASAYGTAGSGTFTFTKTANGWSRNGNAVNIAAIGITILRGNPVTNDTISVTAANAVTFSGSIATCAILPAALMDDGIATAALNIYADNALLQTLSFRIDVCKSPAAVHDYPFAGYYYAPLAAGYITSYADLIDKPRIGGVELIGDQTAAALGLATATDISGKAAQTALDATNRSLDALWKVTQGQVWDFQTVTGPAYNTPVPSGAHYVSIDMLGGRSRVATQLFGVFQSPSTTQNGVTYSISNGVITVEVDAGGATADTEWKFADYRQTNTPDTTHKYLLFGGLSTDIYLYPNSGIIRDYGSGAVFTATNASIFSFFIRVKQGTPAGTYTVTPKLVDLYSWFGSNELAPSDPSSNDIREVKAYVNANPAYTTGTVVSAKVTKVRVYGSDPSDITDINVPTEIQNLSGYGECKPNYTSLMNYIDFATKTFHKVGHIENNAWVNETAQDIDISDKIPDGFLENIAVEAGGIVEFRRATAANQIITPFQASYIVKLSEVTP